MSYFRYVGRLLSNVKGFYNEINSATLTGAIDTVIVQQEDGTYICSPFHVRFGKLGVLHSREKVVDIEINGETVDLHMKLGESGEAFFVEELDGDIQEIPAYLATSPIPSSEDLMAMGVMQLHKEAEQQERELASLQEAQTEDPLETDVHLEKIEETAVKTITASTTESLHSNSLKNKDSSVIKQSQTNVTKSTRSSRKLTHVQKRDSALLDSDNSSKESGSREVTAKDSSQKIEEVMKCKRRRKKKTPHKKSNPRLAGKSESKELKMTKSDNAEGIFDLEVTTDEEDLPPLPSLPHIVKSASLPLAEEDRMDMTNIWANSQFEAHIHPFSDTDVTPMGSPSTTRCPSPTCKSDTECEKRRHEDADPANQLLPPEAEWEWGQLPKSLPSPTQELPSSGKDSPSDNGTQQDSSVKGQQGSGGLFYFMRKTKAIRHKPEEEGIYLADLTKEEMDPEIAKLYFPKSSFQFQSIRDKEEDTESGQGASLPQSPHSVEGAIGGPPASYLMSEVRHLGEVSLSLCGGLAESEGHIPMENFMQSVVTIDTLCDDLNLIQHPDLVVRIGDKFYNWSTAAPQILSLVAFQKYLPEQAVQNLIEKHMPKKKGKKGGVTSWFSWRRAPPNETQTSNPDTSTTTTINVAASDDGTTSTTITTTTLNSNIIATVETKAALLDQTELKSSVIEPAEIKTAVTVSVEPAEGEHVSVEPVVTEVQTTDRDNSQAVVSSSTEAPVAITKRSEAVSETVHVEVKVEKTTDEATVVDISSEVTAGPVTGILESPASSAPSSPKKTPTHHIAGRIKDEDSSENETDSSDKSRAEIQSVSSESADQNPNRKYQKSLRLSSQQIMKLKLHEGQNEITFSVTTQYQGTSRCTSHIYLWRYDDKIVISDIDGTITKSDVLGQILPILGRDWSQSGVAELYTKINNNGYKFIYLSARAIGQSKVTKDLLRNIRQDDLVLPEGPLMLSPISLISAFHREVIEKKPEEFKIKCMSDIAQLFPQTQRPFYAGFGNKINDVYAYKALDIPFSRIFTINHRGELRHEKILTFQSSYQKLVDVVDHFFPPLQRKVYGKTILHSEVIVPNEFRSVSYWREPLPEINVEELATIKVTETNVKETVTVKVEAKVNVDT